MSETAEAEKPGDPEVVLYDEHPTMFQGNPFYFVGAILLIPVGGIGLLLLLGWWVYCKQTRVTLDATNTLVERGILSKDRIEMRHGRVRAVHVYQSFLQRMTGAGDVQVYTTGDNPEFTVRNMPNPHRIREIINEYGS
ncbi:MAG TPA: PH domain-containing protein [Thermohalobaculum sp.]|nr:PH domain-containing protein [Thermohalobaculum sp.]